MKNSTDAERETWIVEIGGAVIEKEAAHGAAALTRLEQLILCVWAADYGMRNAGNLETASDIHPGFQEEAASLARDLGMPRAHAAFSLSPAEFEARYFDVLRGVIEEIDARRDMRGGP
jgi:hypothetical protein